MDYVIRLRTEIVTDVRIKNAHSLEEAVWLARAGDGDLLCRVHNTTPTDITNTKEDTYNNG